MYEKYLNLVWICIEPSSIAKNDLLLLNTKHFVWVLNPFMQK